LGVRCSTFNTKDIFLLANFSEEKMIVSHVDKTPSKSMEMPGVKAAAMKVLIGEPQGWNDHVMRIIELDEDGYSPQHAHPWPHINYMLEGQGVLDLGGQEHAVSAGSYAFVPADIQHQFRNAGSGKFRFICIVPKEGHK
jgi:quercetin dioxygenase-like cupin family protein